ncbi:uncharacterized protein LOC144782067 [Lissotriton helveticus]
MQSPSSEVLKEFEELVAAPLTHSSTLFLQEDGSPMHFYVPPGPWKRLLSPLIEHGGGLLCRMRQPRALLLAPPGEGFKGGPDAYISARFVAECVRAGELLDPDAFRLVPEELTTRPCCSHELVPGRLNGRSSFTRAEDLAILMYIRDYVPVGASVTGTTVWKEMSLVQLTRHSWQAMKSRYLKKLRGRESEYQLQARTVIPTLVYPHCSLCRDTRGFSTTAGGQEEEEDSVEREASGDRDIQEDSSTLAGNNPDEPLEQDGLATQGDNAGSIQGAFAPPLSSTKVSSTEGALVLNASNQPAGLEISEVAENADRDTAPSLISNHNDKRIVDSDRGRQVATGGSLEDRKKELRVNTSSDHASNSPEVDMPKGIVSTSLGFPEPNPPSVRKLDNLGHLKAAQCNLESQSLIIQQAGYEIDLSAETEDERRSVDLHEKCNEVSAAVATSSPLKKDVVMCIKGSSGEKPQKEQGSGGKNSVQHLNTPCKDQSGEIRTKFPLKERLLEGHHAQITKPPLDETPLEERELESSDKAPQHKMDHRDQNAGNGIKRSRDEATHKDQDAVVELKDTESSEEEEVQIKRRKKTSVNELGNLGSSKSSVPVKCKGKQWPRIRHKCIESSDDEEFQIKRRIKAPPVKGYLHIFEKANEEFESEDYTPDLANLTTEKTKVHQRSMEHPSPEQIFGLQKHVLDERSRETALEEGSKENEHHRSSPEHHICEQTQGMKHFVTYEDSRLAELEGDALNHGPKENEQCRRSPELQICEQTQGLRHFVTSENSRISELDEDLMRNTQCSGSQEPLPCWQPLRLNQFVCGEDSQIDENLIQANVAPCSPLPSQTEVDKATKSLQSLMNEFGLSLATVTQAFLKNSGELKATKYFLKNSVRPDGYPIWSRQDDLDLQNENSQLICNLNNKFGAGNVAKRIAFLRS